MWAVGRAQSHKDFLCGSNFWESGNRDKQGSDDEDDDGRHTDGFWCLFLFFYLQMFVVRLLQVTRC